MAYRMAAIGSAARDRLELRLDPNGEPPTIGRAFKHIAMLGCAASMIDRDVPVSIVFPPVVGEGDLSTLARMASRLGGSRAKNTTVFLELPRRRGEHSEMTHVVDTLRACKLKVGIVCRTHSLSGLALLSELEPDELELHLARAPAGTLQAYCLVSEASEWRLSIADLVDGESLKALATTPVEYVGGPLIGEGGPPSEILESLRQAAGNSFVAKSIPLGRTG